MSKKVLVPSGITVGELARKLEVSPSQLIKKLMGMSIWATINQSLEWESIQKVCQSFGYEAEPIVASEEEEPGEEKEDPRKLKPRPPIVTVMGHVDHGKTTLLDTIRKTRVAAQEWGGLTQHIGAYKVRLPHGEVVFLDTPGHEAFSSMRARGARVTDIVVLVVAADDGVMPQTIEAVNHCKEANVPIVVAVNKVDKPSANPERVKQQLSELGLTPEEWGGNTIFVEVSALQGTGLDHLLEMLLLEAEMLELKANPDSKARGTVIESRVDRGKGIVATVLVQKGTLREGEAFIAGSSYGKVRAMFDDQGRKTRKADPSTPVEVLGFVGLPQAGDVFQVVKDEREARSLALKKIEESKDKETGRKFQVSLSGLHQGVEEGKMKELPIILKGDVQGSVEALTQALESLSGKEVALRVLHGAVGGINVSDVMLASASGAIILGFNVSVESGARELAEENGVEIRQYRVIYELIDDVRKAMEGLLEPLYTEKVVGKAEVRQVFALKKRKIAGVYIIEGKVIRNLTARVLRDGEAIHQGKIISLRRFKESVQEVGQGVECGMEIENLEDLREGDLIEILEFEESKRTL